MIDRLAYWYYHPREWLKKVALMDDVYLLNSPFTFQSMEKHSAYCALMRLGMNVPETVLVPYKNPVDNVRWAYTSRALQRRVRPRRRSPHEMGYPLFMKPFDGGGWRGVSQDQATTTTCIGAYDESGEMLMHLQKSVEPYDVFARALTIGPETMVMNFRPDEPMHNRYAVDARLPRPAGVGAEAVTIAQTVNAFFRWEFNSCEMLVQGDGVLPDRLRQRLPRRRGHLAALLLPVGDDGAGEVVGVLRRHRPQGAHPGRHRAVVRGRRRPGLDYGAKLAAYQRLADEHFDTRALPGVLRDSAAAHRRDGAGLGAVARVRRDAGQHRRHDLPGRTSTSSSWPLPRV